VQAIIIYLSRFEVAELVSKVTNYCNANKLSIQIGVVSNNVNIIIQSKPLSKSRVGTVLITGFIILPTNP
jgi:hypothetical protein